MPATRWSYVLSEIQNWGDEAQADFMDLILNPIVAQVNPEETAEQLQLDGEDQVPPSYPEELPILPLRGVVVYPQTGVPLTIGQPRSIKLVDEAVSTTRLIGLLASKNSELENPGPEDLYSVGTIATIHRLFRAPDGTIRLLIQGMARFRLVEFSQTEPYLKAKIEVFPEVQETGLEVEALARNARDQFEHIAEMIPSIPRELVSSVSTIEDPLQITYTIANFQRMDMESAQAILELDKISDKLHKLIGILTREGELLELGQKIQNEARSEIEKVQREYFLREQLKAIQKELGESDEQAADIEEFRKKINAAKMPDEADKQARRELDLLSRLPTAAA